VSEVERDGFTMEYPRGGQTVRFFVLAGSKGKKREGLGRSSSKKNLKAVRFPKKTLGVGVTGQGDPFN